MDIFELCRFVALALSWRGEPWTTEEWGAAVDEDEALRRRLKR